MRYDGAKAGWVHSDCPDKRKGAFSAEKNQTTCNANSRADSLCFVGTMQRDGSKGSFSSSVSFFSTAHSCSDLSCQNCDSYASFL